MQAHPDVRVRAWVGLWALAAVGCGYTVPRPNIPRDAVADGPVTDVGLQDASLDATVLGDGTVSDTTDLGTATDGPRTPEGGMDVLGDAPGDVPGDALGDAPTDVPRADAGDARTDAPGMTLDGAGRDASGDGGCSPGDRRPCYTGPATSQDNGACRDGIQVCDATGTWPAGCTGQVLPDCAARMCGSDTCGGSCGTCPAGLVCDEAGQCVTRTCGMEGFTVPCPDGTHCPTGSSCVGGGSCACNPGYTAVDCTGASCSPCTYPSWLCVPAPFCGGGSVLCPTGTRCPRHSDCDPGTGACRCSAGYQAVTCSGTRCDTCPGTDYRCVPVPLP